VSGIAYLLMILRRAGLHFQEELKIDNPIISIDGIPLNDFDFIDVGALIPSSGAVPVVIKSLIFPASPEQ